MNLLQQFLLEAKQQQQQITQLHDSAIMHGTTLCNLVEGYSDSCDDADIEKASEILTKVGKALEMTNQITNGEQRTKHVARITDLISSVRTIIQGMVDQVKVKQEENEEDLDSFLDQFLSQIESIVGDDPEMDDPEMGDPEMGDPEMGDPEMGDPEMGDPEIDSFNMEDEEYTRGMKRNGNYRSSVRRSMHESQHKQTFTQYLSERLS